MTVATDPGIGLRSGTAECPAGFAAGGIACGIKTDSALDLALIVADRPCAAAAMFTRNLVRAAPVEISALHLKQSLGRARAILINSGCANAATGAEGTRRAQQTATALSKQLGCGEEHILINSTGVIGVQLPHEKIIAALPDLSQQLSPQGLAKATAAIMTTDTRSKLAEFRCEHDGRTLHVAGIARGSGMVHPNMATMIAVLLTDAEVDPPQLDRMLRKTVDKSFHRISVDGDTSTNDSVFAIASGQAGEFPEPIVQEAMNAVAKELALMVVRDGEGAQKLIHVRVNGARTSDEALQVAKTIAGSMLVRTAVAGGDPNWGRILAAVGRSGVEVDPDRISISANGVPLFEEGAPADSPLHDRDEAFRSRHVVLDIDLGHGDASDEFFTCDLTEEYVRINAHYMT